jgi:hypothetical protein
MLQPSSALLTAGHLGVISVQAALHVVLVYFPDKQAEHVA